MPKLSEALPLEILRAAICVPQKAPQKSAKPQKAPGAAPKPVPKASPRPGASGGRPQQNPQRPMGTPRPGGMPAQQRPSGFPQNQMRPGGMPAQQQQVDPVQMDQQLLEQISLAVGKLMRISKIAKPGQEDTLNSAKKVLRVAHTHRLAGNYDGAQRHLQNAHNLMNKVDVKLQPLPRPLNPKDLQKRRVRQQEQESMRQARTQAKTKQITQPPQPKRFFGR